MIISCKKHYQFYELTLSSTSHFSAKNGEVTKQIKEEHNVEKKSSSKSDESDSLNSSESSAEGQDTAKDKEDEKKDDQDVVFVQDVGFTIKITAPGVEPFDIQVFEPST